MSEPLEDDPKWLENIIDAAQKGGTRIRVLALAREMMLADVAFRGMDSDLQVDNYVYLAEKWISCEDAYELPEAMR